MLSQFIAQVPLFIAGDPLTLSLQDLIPQRPIRDQPVHHFGYPVKTLLAEENPCAVERLRDGCRIVQ